MPSSYNLLLVAVSLAMAMFASYVSFDMARRVRTSQRGIGLAWWAAGSLVMGTGIWSMHFVGMQALELPIPIGYSQGLTFASWLAAVTASGIALELASRKRLDKLRILLGAMAMGGGITAMHYLGMAAMRMSPGITWNMPLVALSVLVSFLASTLALLIFKLLRRVERPRRMGYQLAAAFVFAMAICGTHYLGMAAASFAAGSVCLTAGELGGPGLQTAVAMIAGALLVVTLLTSILDSRLQRAARGASHSMHESNARLQAANEELQQRAFADPLTGLPNRLLFEDRLAQATRRLERSNHDGVVERMAVLFVDLDGFKPINDSFGHAVGDVVIRKAASRLRDEARDCDTVARVGGDEFLILLNDVADEQACISVAQRVLASLSQPFEASGRRIEISCSIGIVVHPGHSESNKIVANADAAMYAAKRAGGSCYALFEPHMVSDVSEQLALQSDLRHALERGQLSLHYQPKIDGRRGQISGVEALLRWNHPLHGMVSPLVFIPLAERIGLIGRLGQWVIDEACRQTAEWGRDGLRMRVAVNLSVHQLRDKGLVDRIGQTLQDHGLDASQLLCEITETVAMEDIKAVQHTFEGLGDIGVYLSIDDFGTGYSSLRYLSQLPARQLKIDRSFVGDLEHSTNARAVVAAVVGLAHALGLRVVAEGVETERQRDILLAMDCDELQGFLFARPMPPTALLAWAHGAKPEGGADFTPSLVGALAPL